MLRRVHGDTIHLRRVVRLADSPEYFATNFRNCHGEIAHARMAALFQLSPMIDRYAAPGNLKCFNEMIPPNTAELGKALRLLGNPIRLIVRFLRRRVCSQDEALSVGGVAETFIALNRGPRVRTMEICLRWSPLL